MNHGGRARRRSRATATERARGTGDHTTTGGAPSSYGAPRAFFVRRAQKGGIAAVARSGAPSVEAARGAPSVEAPRDAPSVEAPRGAPSVEAPRDVEPPRRGAIVAVAVVAALAAGMVACSAEPGPVRGPAAAPSAVEVPSAAPSASAAVTGPEYVLSDLERRPAGTTVTLEKGARGVLVDGARAIASEAGVTFATESVDGAIRGFDRVPARLGGGFLFRGSDSLYASATFDGALRAVATFHTPIASVSFGPDAVLVRGTGGERWSVDLATGARKAPAPLGLVDVAALDDGRAIAVTEGGGASISSDAGKTWRDARAQLQGAAGSVSVRDGELWLVDRLAQGERALRLDRSGALAEMVGLPAAPAPIKQDPRFASGDGPLRAALRSGVRSGPWTAVIGAGGDVIRVDLATGAIASTSPGVVPLRMACEAMEIPDDIAIVCAERGKASVVVTHVLHGREPRVERSFPTDGPFYAGEGGALAYGGPCGPLPSDAPAASTSATAVAPATPSTPAPPLPSVCVRNSDGQWEPFVLDEEAGKPRPASPGRRDKGGAGASGTSGAVADPAAPGGGKQAAKAAAAAASGTSSGAPPPRIRAEDVRWIPRAGRAPVAVIAGKELASYDSAWGEVRPWQVQGAARDLVDAARRHAAPRHDAQILDQRWAATSSGAVQALLDDGRAIEVSPDGVITVWPFTFDRVAVAGPLAFAKGSGGRAFQTLDRGRTWAEIAAPPGPGLGAFDPRACSSLGCDLGSWLRIGWTPSAPVPRLELARIPRAASLPSPPLLELTCLPTGQTDTRSVTTTTSAFENPADLGLGATRLPPRVDDGLSQFETRAFARAPVNLAYGQLGLEPDAAPRALQSGFIGALLPSDREDEPFGRVGTLGPSRAASAFKPELAFVEPLVPASPIRRVTYTFDAIARAVKTAGVTLPDLLLASNLELQSVVPVTPAPSAKGRTAPSGELLASFMPTTLGTLYLVARGGASPRAEVLFARPGGIAQSAARLANGDLVALAIGEASEETILRFGASGVTEIATLPAAPSSSTAPPNPDVIAINAKGEIALIRTPSGFEPASLGDPALLILPGPKVSALAPWAAAVAANDPSCAGPGDGDAYRATLQTSAAWVKIAGRPFFDGAQTGMTARVRWGASRLCVEALEIPERGGMTNAGRSLETVVVATFAPDEAGRAEIDRGTESRSALSCALAPR